MSLEFFKNNKTESKMTRADFERYALKSKDPKLKGLLSSKHNAGSIFTFDKGFLLYKNKKPNLEICHFYVAPDSKIKAEEIWSNLKGLAKELDGIENITMRTERNNKAWERLVGFKTVKTVYYMRYKV